MATSNFFRGRKFLKDKKVTIEEGTDGVNDNGFPIEKWFPIENGENIWAYYRHASGEEIYAAKAESYKVEAVFKINWRDDINLSMKVLFRGNEYGITRIDDYEGYKKDLTLYGYVIDPE